MTTTTDYNKQATDFLSKVGATIEIKFLKHGKHFADDKEERDIYAITLAKGGKEYTFNFGNSLADSCKEVLLPLVNTKDKIEVFAGIATTVTQRRGSVKFELLKKDHFALSNEKLNKLATQMLTEFYTSYNGTDYREKELIKNLKAGRINIDTFRKKTTLGLLTLERCREKIEQAIKEKMDEKVSKWEELPANEKVPPTAYDVITCLQKYDVGTFENFCDEFGYDTDSRKAYKVYKAVREEYKSLCTLFSAEEMNQMAEIQ